MITIAICTFNRAQYLEIVLKSLISADRVEDVSIIVIDNNSVDNTAEIVNSFKNINYIFEPKQGLSHARNRAVDITDTDWLLFIDDDCKIQRNTLVQTIYTINNYPYKLFTGVFKAWYRLKPPKWFPYDLGNYTIKGSKSIRTLDNDYISGGIMCLHIPTFNKVCPQGFPINLGMIGSKIGYGEETYIENIYREKGIPLGINPNMIIFHVVREEKYKISWMISYYYSKGRTTAHLGQMTTKRILYNSLRWILYNMKKRKSWNRSYKKILIDVISPLIFLSGYIKESSR